MLNDEQISQSLLKISKIYFGDSRVVRGEVNGLRAIGIIANWMGNSIDFSFNQASFWWNMSGQRELEEKLRIHFQALQTKLLSTL